MIPIDPSDLYELRTLVFMETEPQSNQYRQLVLSPGEYADLTSRFGVVRKKRNGIEEIELTLSEETYDLPDLNSHE